MEKFCFLWVTEEISGFWCDIIQGRGFPERAILGRKKNQESFVKPSSTKTKICLTQALLKTNKKNHIFARNNFLLYYFFVVVVELSLQVF